MSPWVRGLCLLLALAGCAPTAQVDLLERPFLRLYPESRLDMADETLSCAGFWPQAEKSSTVFRWAVSREVAVSLSLPRGAAALDLELLAPPGEKPQRLVFSLDDQELEAHTLPSGWSRLVLELPAQEGGLHRLEIKADWASTFPELGERRTLAFGLSQILVLAEGAPRLVADRNLGFLGKGEMGIPGGGVARWPMVLSGPATLFLEVEAEDVFLEVAWQTETGEGLYGPFLVQSGLISRKFLLAFGEAGAGQLELRVRGTWDQILRVRSATLGMPLPERGEVVQEEGRRPRGVIVYLLDALRADVLGVYGHPGGNSPHLDRWSRRGQVFSNFYGHAAWTRPALATLWTGLMPWEHGVQKRDSILPEQAETLAEAFSGQGWFTGMVLANANLAPVFGMTQGFERVVEGLRREGHSKLRSDDLNVQAEVLLDAAGELPFFLFLHSVDPHHPYVPQAGFEGKSAYGRYQSAVRGNDERIGKLFGILEKRGLLDGVWLFFLADHGEEFQDHGGMRHGQTLYEELIRLPLLVFGMGEGLRESANSMAELSLTLRSASTARSANIHKVQERSSWRSEGAEPLPVLLAQELLDGRQVSSIRLGHHKLIQNRRRIELYNLAADPGETQNLAVKQPILARALQAELMLQLKLQAQNALATESTSMQNLDPKIEAELRALGYIE